VEDPNKAVSNLARKIFSFRPSADFTLVILSAAFSGVESLMALTISSTSLSTSY
jgi:hypothetical protein